jgi:riboflavin kinase / FMN adenylyltransferase
MKALFTFRGIVKKGHKRGKLLGFPTMNMTLEEKPPEGIYVSHCIIDNVKYNALTFIGPAKTYNQKEFLAETYVLDFNADVYDTFVSVFLLKKIRDNEKFDSEKALINQMEEDKKEAEEFFKDQAA